MRFGIREARRVIQLTAMDGDLFGPKSSTERKLGVTHREALALLSALEISPFEDEVLEQKLLNVIYSSQSSRHPERPTRRRDFTHQRRRTG